MSRPWDGLVPEAEIRALESRGKPADRKTTYHQSPASSSST